MIPGPAGFHPLGVRASWWSRPVLQGGKLLRSLHLFLVADAQCGRTGRDAVLGQWPKGAVAWLSVLHHHSVHCGAILFPTACTDTVGQEH